jgi:hypothetical protein
MLVLPTPRDVSLNKTACWPYTFCAQRKNRRAELRIQWKRAYQQYQTFSYSFRQLTRFCTSCITRTAAVSLLNLNGARFSVTRCVSKICILSAHFATVGLRLYRKCFIHGLIVFHFDWDHQHSQRKHMWPDENPNMIRCHHQNRQFSINLCARILGDWLIGLQILSA